MTRCIAPKKWAVTRCRIEHSNYALSGGSGILLARRRPGLSAGGNVLVQGGRMLFKINILCILWVSILSIAPVAMAAGDAQAGMQKAETCIGCHGIAGYKNTYPSFRVPKLRGQHASYIILALKAYRAQERKHPTMRAQAGPLTDQDIEDIAAYIASLK